MGRTIEIEVGEKTYLIEYTRSSVVELIERSSENKGVVKSVVDLIECGLMKHHSKDMPDQEEIFGWVLAMDDVQPFADELRKCVEEVITAIKDTKKQGNLKWGVVKK